MYSIILKTEICLLGTLVVAALATRHSLWTSLRSWLIAISSTMLLTFIYLRVAFMDDFWVGFLILALGVKTAALGLVLVERLERQRQEILEAQSHERNRIVVSTVQHLCDHIDSCLAPPSNKVASTKADEPRGASRSEVLQRGQQ